VEPLNRRGKILLEGGLGDGDWDWEGDNWDMAAG
jgi:hypothetical protein